VIWNIPRCANLHTGYHSCRFSGDILCSPTNNFQSRESIWRWASIQYPSIWIRAYAKEGQDVCIWGFLFWTRLVSWIKGVVRYHSSWQRNGITEPLYSGNGHYYLLYTEPYAGIIYITSRMYSGEPPSVFTVHGNELISSGDSEYD